MKISSVGGGSRPSAECRRASFTMILLKMLGENCTKKLRLGFSQKKKTNYSKYLDYFFTNHSLLCKKEKKSLNLFAVPRKCPFGSPGTAVPSLAVPAIYRLMQNNVHKLYHPYVMSFLSLSTADSTYPTLTYRSLLMFEESVSILL